MVKDVSRRILQIAHNHPQFHAGGTELTALALHREALRLGHDSWYLGALERRQVVPNLGTHMIAITPDQREAAIYCDSFWRFELAQESYFGVLRELRQYLEQLRPDVVHVHHILNFGLELFHVLRVALPEAKIVFTLHDYYLICANNGQLFKHDSRQRCDGPNLADCLKCFPKRSANEFRMRGLAVENALSLCDHLVSPSQFLKEKMVKYLELMRQIEIVENGYLGPEGVSAAPPRVENGCVTFGYFGNVSAVKGLSDLLDAADLLMEKGRTDFRVHVHGTQLFEDKVLAERINGARRSLVGRLNFLGQYKAEEMAGLMDDVDCVVFPSVWWENAPLVIYEALYHGRQVICYPHGGAPEILRRYGVGLFAKKSVPSALADAMEEVLEDKTLLCGKPSKPVPGSRQLFDGYRRFYFD